MFWLCVRRSLSMSVLTCALLAALAAMSNLNAQAAPSGAKTTKGRVYSATQATRGEQTYMSTCVSCHPPSTYKGAVFLNWQGRTLGELLEFLTEKMPKNDPGSLSPKEYTQVVAYLLKLNGMPAGRVDLPADPAALRDISINILPDKLALVPSLVTNPTR
ncbi:MAG: cytochrome c [Acidobacteria bacterium]|nr:cytochrome c [Acidobacteriota bacterium]